MIRRFRYALTIVRDISMILCPASASVRAGVRDADLLTEREAAVDVMEPWRFGPVAMCAADHSPGVVCADADFPGASSPTPGHPVEDLVEFHRIWQITSDGVYCACHHRSRNFHGHAKHVSGFVLAMVEADARIAAANNNSHR